MELKVDGHRAPFFLVLSRVLKIVAFYQREWQLSAQDLDSCQELLIIDPRHHEFTRMNLNASPLPDAPLSMSHRQIFKVVSEGTQVNEINFR
jgi:hypothetical protein